MGLLDVPLFVFCYRLTRFSRGVSLSLSFLVSCPSDVSLSPQSFRIEISEGRVMSLSCLKVSGRKVSVTRQMGTRRLRIPDRPDTHPVFLGPITGVLEFFL